MSYFIIFLILYFEKKYVNILVDLVKKLKYKNEASRIFYD